MQYFPWNPQRGANRQKSGVIFGIHHPARLPVECDYFTDLRVDFLSFSQVEWNNGEEAQPLPVECLDMKRVEPPVATPPAPPAPSHAKPHTSRGKRIRARLRHAAFTTAPIFMSGGRLARVRADRPIHVTRQDILLPRLPNELDGLRIAHVSDLHIGKLITPDHLPGIFDSIAALDADMIAMTGDFLDLSVKVSGKIIESLKKLDAPLGVHMVMGNHDYLDDGSEFIRQLKAADLGLLLNESLVIPHLSKSICISGIDFAHKQRDLARLVHRTLRRACPSGGTQHDFHMLLAHDPNAFRYAPRHNIDLMLAGHTHGGQIMFKPQRIGKRPLGPASLAFKFPRGHFKEGDSHLFVTSGVGSWFPLRVNCPPEVAELTLRRATTA